MKPAYITFALSTCKTRCVVLQPSIRVGTWDAVVPCQPAQPAVGRRQTAPRRANRTRCPAGDSPKPCKASKQLGNVRRGEQAYSSLLVLNPAYPSHAVQLPRADHIPAPLACHPTPQGALPRPGAMPPEPNPHRERTGPWYVPAPKHSGASHSPPSSGPCGATRPTNSPRRKTHDDEAPHQTNPTRANARK